MLSKLYIRKAKQEDLASILQLQKDCYQSEAEIYNDYSIQPLMQTIEELEIEFENSIVLAGFINDNLVASVRGYINNNVACINKLIVKPEFQNKGIGKQMMIAIENETKGCNCYELFTGNRSFKNISLYEKSGYEIFNNKKINNNLTLVYLRKIILQG